MQLDAEASLHLLANVELRCRDSFACGKNRRFNIYIPTDEIEDSNVKVGKGTRGRGRIILVMVGVVGCLRHVQQLGDAVCLGRVLSYT